ncbi:hypothetical protein JTB14_009764 [Gonioctena quinquepunctata]|nr:hypothetical protein JTB14_009764 [Gonioctena quinquepunctata]
MDDAKKYIKSLLTSTPSAMTIQQLSKDYRNLIGEPIPYQRLGFNSLEHFLRSITDTVRLRGTGPFAEVILVMSEKSSHIMELVSSQKTVPKKKNGYLGRRTVIFTPPKEYYRQHLQSPSPPEQKPTKIHYPNYPSHSNTPVVNQKPPIFYPTDEHHGPKYDSGNNIEMTNRLEALPTQEAPMTDKSIYKPHGNSNGYNEDKKLSPFKYSNGFTDTQNNLKPAEYPKIVNDISKNNKLNDYTKFSNDSARSLVKSYKKTSHYSERVKAPSVENLEDIVPQSIQSNLRILIGQYPDGIWCANVPVVYRQIFGRELKYLELGFRSLIDLCTCLKSIFHYVRPSTEDFKLYDRSKPLPKSAEKTYTIASYGDGKANSEKYSGAALPNIDWEDMLSFLPPCTFKPGEEIQRAFVSESTSENDSIDIKVGEIYDISKFWIYIDDKILDNVMDDMQEFYNANAKEYAMPENLIREGLYCAHIIFGEYHRALIVNIVSPQEEMIRVVYIDYGTVAKVSKKELCFLHEKFTKLPAQAIRCRLANICPPEKGAPWSRESSRAFRQLIARKELTAKVSRINWMDQYLEIFLADVTDENNVFYINDVLVEQGYAVYPDQGQQQSVVDSISTPLVHLIHLFPTFVEIEHGLAPSTSEMDLFHECNVPINFCYPQYFKFETSEEEHIIKYAVSFHETNCLKEHRNHNVHAKYYIDKTKINPDPLDFGCFGKLESDILAFHESTLLDVEQFDDAVEESEDVCQEDDIAIISRRLELLKTQTVNELRKDCLLSEDIMREILYICGNGENNFEDKREVESSDERLCTITEEGSLDTSFGCRENLSDEFSGELESEHPLTQMTFEYDGYSNVDPVVNQPQTPVEKLEESQTEAECSNSVGRKEDATNPFAFSNTNPFLTDIENDDKESSELGTLHPTNPFLTYIKPKVENSSDDSEKSSNSTLYDYVEEIKVQKWSTNDRVSDMISASCYSGSSESIPAVQSCATSTQTVDEGITKLPLVPQTNPYGVQMSSLGANWNPSFGGNPYYSHGLPNYGYPFEQPFYPPVHHFGYAQTMPAQRPPICPPPGFAPRTNFQGNFGFGFATGDVPNGTVGLFRPPAQFNCVSRTATMSNMIEVENQAGYAECSVNDITDLRWSADCIF